MQQLMIMVTEVGKLEHTCNLLAEINKKGEVIKIYDHNGNELKINFLNNEVYFNKTWWQFTNIQSLI
ncbi:TPA: hypothetical protein ACSBZ5_003417 [Acinetobacter baumannii]|uniref:hypothetical protein n=1 Tax=Acinetobacter baumannii TaxID=470 RepID=UPI001C0577BE|nr:hypothetical protein [Acinetobacter baumannii]ELH2057644.1 hypothetical protein [Acinetobacter baumannii]MBU0345165.1 hypothetical protein [Acinetobacter baumannii]MCF4239221.1 hypothetical protein [Acinetobacter baumannii]UMN95575.1 hypothetical protein L2Z30_15185 [Acinetobacter baumannii]